MGCAASRPNRPEMYRPARHNTRPAGFLNPAGWKYKASGNGALVGGQPQSKGGFASFKHSQRLNHGDVLRVQVVEGLGAIVGCANWTYDVDSVMTHEAVETERNLAFVGLMDGTTFIGSNLSLDEENHYHINYLERHIPTAPFDMALRCDNGLNNDGVWHVPFLPQIQFNDDGVWHDFAPGRSAALKTGTWFPYLELFEGARLIVDPRTRSIQPGGVISASRIDLSMDPGSATAIMLADEHDAASFLQEAALHRYYQTPEGEEMMNGITDRCRTLVDSITMVTVLLSKPAGTVLGARLKLDLGVWVIDPSGLMGASGEILAGDCIMAINGVCTAGLSDRRTFKSFITDQEPNLELLIMRSALNYANFRRCWKEAAAAERNTSPLKAEDTSELLQIQEALELSELDQAKEALELSELEQATCALDTLRQEIETQKAETEKWKKAAADANAGIIPTIEEAKKQTQQEIEHATAAAVAEAAALKEAAAAALADAAQATAEADAARLEAALAKADAAFFEEEIKRQVLKDNSAARTAEMAQRQAEQEAEAARMDATAKAQLAAAAAAGHASALAEVIAAKAEVRAKEDIAAAAEAGRLAALQEGEVIKAEAKANAEAAAAAAAEAAVAVADAALARAEAATVKAEYSEALTKAREERDRAREEADIKTRAADAAESAKMKALSDLLQARQDAVALEDQANAAETTRQKTESDAEVARAEAAAQAEQAAEAQSAKEQIQAEAAAAKAEVEVEEAAAAAEIEYLEARATSAKAKEDFDKVKEEADIKTRAADAAESAKLKALSDLLQARQDAVALEDQANEAETTRQKAESDAEVARAEAAAQAEQAAEAQSAKERAQAEAAAAKAEVEVEEAAAAAAAQRWRTQADADRAAAFAARAAAKRATEEAEVARQEVAERAEALASARAEVEATHKAAKAQEAAHVRATQEAHELFRKNARALFEKHDANANGTIDQHELQLCLSELGLSVQKVSPQVLRKHGTGGGMTTWPTFKLEQFIGLLDELTKRDLCSLPAPGGSSPIMVTEDDALILVGRNRKKPRPAGKAAKQ